MAPDRSESVVDRPTSTASPLVEHSSQSSTAPVKLNVMVWSPISVSESSIYDAKCISISCGWDWSMVMGYAVGARSSFASTWNIEYAETG